MAKMRIVVTQKDIDNANKFRATQYMGSWCQNCAVARAFHRHKGFENYIVNGRTYYSKFGPINSFEREKELPEKARQFIKDFDNKLPVSPIQFTVEV